MIAQSTKELLEGLGRAIEETKDKLIPDEYWEKEQQFVDKLHEEQEAFYRSIQMTPEKWHQRFT